MKKIVIARSPLRISFVGGGTDLKEFYQDHEGEVFSAAINKYVYILANKYHDNSRCLLKYSKTENVSNIKDIKHPLIRHALNLTNSWGLDINSVSDVSSGTGLGSSSSFTVSLLNGLCELSGKKISKEQLAEKACFVEINKAKSPIGKQDQYAASFGGINHIKFKRSGKVLVKQFRNKYIMKELKKRLIVINTGVIKNNFKILKEQKKNINLKGESVNNLLFMKNSVSIFYKELLNKNFQNCGEIIHENWIKKTELSKNINNDFFSDIYEECLNLGAYGGKILGAGGRGYLLLIAPTNKIPLIKKKFKKLNFLDFDFENEGSKIIYSA